MSLRKNVLELIIRGTCQTSTQDAEKKVLMDPKCKTAIITGGTGGIGFATAHQLLANKARVVALLGTDPRKGLEAVRNLNCAYGRDKAVFVKCDVRNKCDIEEVLTQLKSDYEKMEIIVNAAGIWNDKEWEQELAVNLSGIIITSLAAEKYLDKENGVVINLAGTLGLQPVPPSPILAALQSGVIQLSQSLGHDLNFRRTGIRYVALCPGITQTDFSKDVEKRVRTPEEARDLENFLKKAHRQKPDVCAKSVVELIKYGPTGSTWVIEGSRLFYLNLPDWKKHCNLVSQFT
ncbi:hypothetical protein NQ318_002667 [Aromia moschata]|uniref:Alcohol dehydrogenase n=1 Tax=Aromia moschata TaxID=1265417 RepID=A0AAV8XUQ2_9CUCU|nr:hypothetical protein NQ318_002667 [Aromia moschata]